MLNKEKLERYQKKIRLRNIYLERINSEIGKLRLELAENCDHPPEVIEDYIWEHDDGYGTQRKIHGLRCTICFKKKRWSTIGQWSD